jgi:hypothetical protein
MSEHSSKFSIIKNWSFIKYHFTKPTYWINAVDEKMLSSYFNRRSTKQVSFATLAALEDKLRYFHIEILNHIGCPTLNYFNLSKTKLTEEAFFLSFHSYLSTSLLFNNFEYSLHV